MMRQHGFAFGGAVVAALVIAPATFAATFTLTPGQSKHVGRYTVVCSAKAMKNTATRLVLRVGFQVTVAHITIKCRALRPQPVPTPTPTPTPIPTPTPTLGTRANPYPIGTAVTNGSWRVTVNSVTPDAWGLIQAANMFNKPPAPGGQDFMANLTVSYLGTGSASVSLDFGLLLGVVGQGGVEYVDWTNSCGVEPPPRDIDYTTVFSGATFGLNVCWQVPANEVASLELEFGRHTSTTTWLALH